MGTHQIIRPDTSQLDFELWEGPPPPLLPYAANVFSRPGVNGSGLQVGGRHQEAVSVTLHEDFTTYALAMAFIGNYDSLPSLGACSVVYNSVNWSNNYDVQHLVTEPRIVDVRKAVHLCGPGYAYSGGARVTLAVRLTPVPRV